MKYSVLTYIFGDGEILREAPIDANVEYVCVTDNPNLTSKSWKVIMDSDLKDLHPLQASFYVRYHPFKYCSGDICIRIDGSIQIKESLLSIFEQFEQSEKDICVMTNSRATTIITEMFKWSGYSKVLSKQLPLYQKNKINILTQGSLQSPFSITKNTELCNSCDELCYSWIYKLYKECGSVRPSQALMTAAVQCTEGLNVMFIDESLIQSNYMQWYHHNSERIRKSKTIFKHSQFFGKPIQIEYFK